MIKLGNKMIYEFKASLRYFNLIYKGKTFREIYIYKVYIIWGENFYVFLFCIRLFWGDDGR